MSNWTAERGERLREDIRLMRIYSDDDRTDEVLAALAEIERLRALLENADELATVASNASNAIDGYYYPLNEQLENAAEKYKESRQQEG